MRVVDLCRQNGISDATFYKWRNKFGGMNISDAKRLRQLEDENVRLKRLVGEQALDIVVLRDVLSKNFLTIGEWKDINWCSKCSVIFLSASHDHNIITIEYLC